MNTAQRTMKMLVSPRSRSAAIHGMAFAGILFSQTGLAFAAGDVFQPIQSVFTTLLNFMTGTFATTAATIACAAVGYLALTSRIPWSWCFSIIVGIAFIFGGSQLVTTMSSGLGN
ncbi:type VI secretion protein [Neorhizobium sp. P12A]|jgi:type IV secretion system protein VirB2|uniref:TrbC/VirB2 family protein n=1 Tax=Rhizobium/Agrobacterium group TaxID=227290 RepID=UPI0010477258|nr:MULTISPECIES: TrbC/VirB2 family protein [Rhizobium/Agrobacterium group]KAA0689442.1 type VI secretion protein [Neorhizobium sp. P12A]TCR74059.1 type IV secretion system protein VirB2 [Rhizobium sp. BK376]